MNACEECCEELQECLLNSCEECCEEDCVDFFGCDDCCEDCCCDEDFCACLVTCFEGGADDVGFQPWFLCAGLFNFLFGCQTARELHKRVPYVFILLCWLYAVYTMFEATHSATIVNPASTSAAGNNTNSTEIPPTNASQAIGLEYTEYGHELMSTWSWLVLLGPILIRCCLGPIIQATAYLIIISF